MQVLCSVSKPCLEIIIFLSCLLFPKYSFSQTPTGLYISEFLASNESINTDEEGEYADWIELHNPTGTAINLAGYYLSDNKDKLTKWAFPSITLNPDAYLLVFASGKDKVGEELHSNFKLSSSGEYVILTEPDETTIAFSTQGQYPAQSPDISYGLIDGLWTFLDTPSPLAANLPSNILSPPTFSTSRGFFSEEFFLTLSTPDLSGQIYYTLDGSFPEIDQDSLYSSPILIDKTTIIRAIVSKTGQLPSKAATHSYIFPASVITQTNSPDGYPTNWGPFSTIEGLAPADYEMDAEITQDPAYKDQIIPALLSLPSISLVTNKEHLFSLSTHPDSGGIYIHTNPPTGGIGEDWERPVSFEYMYPDGTAGIQVDAGVRLHGGHSRVPEKNPKHSFRMVFRSEYGPKKLNYDLFGGEAAESFNSLVLRAGFNQTWLHWTGSQRQIAQYINDSWVKDTYREMGHLAAHNKFVHLYLNGMYWGLYNLSERMDKEFMAHYLKGKESEFDVIKDFAEVADGDLEAWNRMMSLANDSSNFMTIQGKDENGMEDPALLPYLDAKNLVDYMILNFYIGNKDWDHHNWVATINKSTPGKGFQFLPWDSERSFINRNDDVSDEDNWNRPSFLFSQFKFDSRFRKLLEERATFLLQQEGLLSPEKAAANWKRISEEIELATIAESARWGDYRRDVHPYKIGSYELYTKLNHWDKEQDRLYNDYFPSRSETVFRQLMYEEIVEKPELPAYPGTFGSFPNPFQETVSIYYELDKATQVQVEILDLSGKTLAVLESRYQNKGLHIIDWKPATIAKGIYLLRIHTAEQDRLGKLVFIK